MPTIKKIGVLTGGGDAPGLNAVIRAVVKTASNAGVTVIGLEDSFDGLIYPEKSRVLTPKDVTGILRFGGTILGTVNRGDPFAEPIETPQGTFDYGEGVMQMFQQMELDALICIGGDGTLAISYEFYKKGIPLVGVPKTIDNDIPATVITFGFDTAVSTATDALDKLHSTAESHKRVMVVELMGRYAGWIALHAGVAGDRERLEVDRVADGIEFNALELSRQEIPITSEQFSVLVHVWDQNGQPQYVLVDKLYKDKTTMARLVASLEQSARCTCLQRTASSPPPKTNARDSSIITLLLITEAQLPLPFSAEAGPSL
jgi:6-phosphofructokinase 1